MPVIFYPLLNLNVFLFTNTFYNDIMNISKFTGGLSMITIDTFKKSDVRQITETKGNFSVLEYTRVSDLAATNPDTAFYFDKQGIRKKQVVIELNGGGIILQAGAMQMMLGNVEAATNVKGVGDMFMKALSSKATGESAIKPKYSGTGLMVLEPTWKYVLLEDLAEWGGSITVDDGLFLACSDSAEVKTVMRSNLSSALAGGEGLFNTAITGRGIVALECPLPREEIIMIDLNNDTVKIDGNNAIAWSSHLNFTVERTTKTLVGSAASGEGLVNVYRGTGKLLIAPLSASPITSILGAAQAVVRR